LEVAPSQSDLAHGLLDRAKRHCLVAKSLNAPVEVVASIRETSAFATAS
jgi:organic hydroperoxide reductase OsmC/OhrA